MKLDIKFELNKKLDKEMTFVFINKTDKIGGADFPKRITDFHPEIESVKNLNSDDQKRIIGEYFDKYYENNTKELESYRLNFQNDWEKIEDKFIGHLNEIFKNPTKPEGKWICYLSTININPRFLNNKTFQVFYKHEHVKEVAIHEILHFFFYDYAIKKFPEIFENLNTNTGIFWQLAELFNNTIQILPEFTELQGEIESFGYPDHKKHQEYLRKLWSEKPDINEWIPKSFEYLKNF